MADDYWTISQVCRRLPGARGARTVTPSTVTRWILSGCPSRSGTRVKLAATRAGSRWLVRPTDLETFFEALAGDPNDRPTSPHINPPTSKTAERAKVAEQKLIDKGV